MFLGDIWTAKKGQLYWRGWKCCMFNLWNTHGVHAEYTRLSLLAMSLFTFILTWGVYAIFSFCNKIFMANNFYSLLIFLYGDRGRDTESLRLEKRTKIKSNFWPFPLSPITKCHIHSFPEHFQGTWFHLYLRCGFFFSFHIPSLPF